MPPGPINVRTPSKCAKEAFEPHKLVVVVGLFYYASTSYHCLSIVTPLGETDEVFWKKNKEEEREKETIQHTTIIIAILLLLTTHTKRITIL